MISTILWYIEPDSNEKCAEKSGAVNGISAEYVYSDGKLRARNRYSDNLCNYFDKRILPVKSQVRTNGVYQES